MALSLALALLLLVVTWQARANGAAKANDGTLDTSQWALRLSGLSDYRWRGTSLSQHHGTVMIDVSLDEPRGWFVGAMVANACLERRCGLASQWDAGWVHACFDQGSCEVGVVRYDYPKARDGGAYDDTEGFVGLSAPQLSMHVFHSEHYLHDSPRGNYLEFDGFAPLAASWRFNVHAGHLFLARADASTYPSVAHSRSDVSLGWSWQGQGSTLSLDWGGVLNARGVCYPGDNRCNKRWVASVSHVW